MKNGIGQQKEYQARTYLEEQGLRFVEANVRYPFGEIDIVMRDSQFWVFIEVKYRRNTRFGGAINALSTKQQRRIQLASSHYLQRNNINAPCRFDVIAIDHDCINWIKAAF